MVRPKCIQNMKRPKGCLTIFLLWIFSVFFKIWIFTVRKHPNRIDNSEKHAFSPEQVVLLWNIRRWFRIRTQIMTYDMVDFKHFDTRFGKKVVVVTASFMCFLPDRFSRIVTTGEQISEFNSWNMTDVMHGVWAASYAEKFRLRSNAGFFS